MYRITYRRRQERNNTVENGIFDTEMGLGGAMNSGFVPYVRSGEEVWSHILRCKEVRFGWKRF
jgi:hypothetical protein